MKNKYLMVINRGFTLSEVLITLVIIGIIAAITVPVIHANYTEQERISRVKKAYSVLANAMTRIKAKGGDAAYIIDESGDMDTMKEWFSTYFAPMITTKVCYATSGCWYNGKTKQLDGDYFTALGGTWGLGSGTIMFVLNDGTTVSFDDSSRSQVKTYFGVDLTDTDTTYTITMFFDINGTKSPNTMGKDVFAVVYDTKRGLVPAYADRTKAQINTDCSNSGTGISCIQKYLKK